MGGHITPVGESAQVINRNALTQLVFAALKWTFRHTFASGQLANFFVLFSNFLAPSGGGLGGPS